MSFFFTYNFGEFCLQPLKNGTKLKRRKEHSERKITCLPDAHKCELKVASRERNTGYIWTIRCTQNSITTDIYSRVGRGWTLQWTNKIDCRKWVGYCTGLLRDHFHVIHKEI